MTILSIPSLIKLSSLPSFVTSLLVLKHSMFPNRSHQTGAHSSSHHQLYKPFCISTHSLLLLSLKQKMRLSSTRVQTLLWCILSLWPSQDLHSVIIPSLFHIISSLFLPGCIHQHVLVFIFFLKEANLLHWPRLILHLHLSNSLHSSTSQKCPPPQKLHSIFWPCAPIDHPSVPSALPRCQN